MLSPDGRWLWDGHQWMPVGGSSAAGQGAGTLFLARPSRRVAAFGLDLVAYIVISIPFWLLVLVVEISVLTPYQTTHLSDHDAAVLLGALAVGSLLGIWLYETATAASRLNGTLGKRIVGIRVVRQSGADLSVQRCFSRAVMKTFSIATVAMGLLWMALTPNRQALHDLVVDSVVVDRTPSSGAREVQQLPVMPAYRRAMLVLLVASAAAVLIGFFADYWPLMLAGFVVFLALGAVAWPLRSRAARESSLGLQEAARPYLSSESPLLIAVGERRLWSTGTGVVMTLLLGWVSILIRTFAAQRLMVALTPSSLVLIELDRTSRAKGLLAKYPRYAITVTSGRSGVGSRELDIKAPDQEIPVIFRGIWAPRAKELQTQLGA